MVISKEKHRGKGREIAKRFEISALQRYKYSQATKRPDARFHGQRAPMDQTVSRVLKLREPSLSSSI